MALSTAWRQFQLFDFTPIKDPNYGTDEPIYSDGTLSCIASTKSYIVIASNDSRIKVVGQNITFIKSFAAYDPDYRINFILSVPNSDLLITFAEKQGLPAILKLWDLNKLVQLDIDDEESTKFKFQTQTMVHNGDNSYPASCIAANENLTCIALGYTNGAVILIRGDLIRDRGSKQRIVFESHDPITGVHFNNYEDLLYVTTTLSILTVPTTGRNNGRPSRVLSDKLGVDLDCSDVDTKTQELIVGQPTAIINYSHVLISNSIKFEVPKRLIKRFGKHFLLIISPSDDYSGNSNPNKLLTKVIIFDLFNMHISFTITIPNVAVNQVFIMEGDIYLLTSDNTLYKVYQKPINQQVEYLLQREVFDVAYTLAIQNKLPREFLLKIKRQQGDRYYEEQKFDDSVDVYGETLKLYDHNQESREVLDDFVLNIITKFKDVSNISNMTKFLNELYKLDLANNDHISLLLCCMCKLKRVDDLDSFIENLNLEGKPELQNLNFQLIINLFKECGYLEQVIKLLFKLNQPDLIVDIKLNDLHEPKSCLEYIKSLSIEELLLILVEYSKRLLDDLPIETTELLINVFTGKYTPITLRNVPLAVDLEKGSDGKVETNGTHSLSFPLNSYTAFLAYISGSSEEYPEKTPVTTSENNKPTYLPPRPSIIFSSFVNNPNEFVIFLEACIEAFDRYQGNIDDKRNLLLTLLEMYLTLAQESDESSWKSKAVGLLKNYKNFLSRPALLNISHIFDFKEGEILAKEQSGFDQSLFTTSQLLGDVDECIRLVYEFGESQPELYIAMLKFLASDKDVFGKADKKDLQFILNQISTRQLATPLEVVQILSVNELATLGMVKSYLLGHFDDQRREITNNKKLAKYYETESSKSSQKLDELVGKSFVMQNTKCSSCDMKLDFPMFHFKCKHSFHQKCLTYDLVVSNHLEKDQELKCPICIADLDDVKSVRVEQVKAKENVEAFEATLNDSNDRFRLMSDYIGKGIMENEAVPLFRD